MNLPAPALVLRFLALLPLTVIPAILIAADAASKGGTKSAATTAAKAATKAAEPAAPLPPPPLPVALYLEWQRDPTTTMTVHWHTDWTEGYVDTVLEYRAEPGPDAKPTWSRATGRSQPMPFTTRIVHTVELTRLRPDTLYEFRLGRLAARPPDGMLLFTPLKDVYKFRTMPAALDRPVRFVAGGDIYNIDLLELTASMCKVAAAQNPEFAVIGGDIAYVNDEPKSTARWFEFFRVWRQTMVTKDGRLIPLVVTIGNHEAHGDTYLIRGGAPNRGLNTERALTYYTVFSFPGRPGYRALDFGKYLSIVALDSDHTAPVAGSQTNWLKDTLAKRRDVTYVVPVYHVPGYPSNRPFDGVTSVAVRKNWVPLFDEAGVRFAFENHDHTYKRTYPLRGGQRNPAGTYYLGDGAWSVNPRSTHPRDEATYLEKAMTKNHVFVVTLNPDRADFVAVDPTGAQFDQFTIPAKP